MANIVVKDLKENAELDRAAMRAIVGGNAGPNLGLALAQPGHFQNPMSFGAPRLVPGLETGGLR